LSGAAVIDGKAFAAGLRDRIAGAVPAFVAAVGRKPGLAVVLVGDDAASAVYVGAKGRACEAAGMASFEHRLPAETSEAALLSLVERLNHDPEVDGILVQMPLPAGLDEQAVIAAISPDKDVDGFHPVNVGRLSTGTGGIVPCTPLGIMMLIHTVIPDLTGKDAVVIGKSNIVGKPVANLLLDAEATVTVTHIYTKDLPDLCRKADVIVAAAGAPRLVKGDWVKPGAVIIDVGITRVMGDDGKEQLLGDVAFDDCQHAKAITPVPGGVGPMTISCLMANTVQAAKAILAGKAGGNGGDYHDAPDRSMFVKN